MIATGFDMMNPQHLLLNPNFLNTMHLVKPPTSDVVMDTNTNSSVALEADKDKLVKLTKAGHHTASSTKQHNGK